MARKAGTGEQGKSIPLVILSNNAGEHQDIASLATIEDTPEYFEDTDFVTGESPAILDFNGALDRNATKGSIINDGPGDFTVAFSIDGANFGDAIRLEINESIQFDKLSVNSIQITWVANSAYRVVAI